MPNHVCHGALLKCSMGVAPSSLVVLPINMQTTSSVPAANIQDHIPMVNIMPFGMCQSPANPMVAAATAAAMGVLTPMPCIPVTPAPWVAGSPTVTLANQPALNKSSMLMCNWAGQISIQMEGQMTHTIP
ncbi:MAG: DUF4280 domain-containing protein [Burkholderiaceae bacterium]|jgi:hypothetical protein